MFATLVSKLNGRINIVLKKKVHIWVKKNPRKSVENGVVKRQRGSDVKPDSTRYHSVVCNNIK